MKIKELVPLASFLVSVTNARTLRAPILGLAQRIERLWRGSGSTMSVQYLKKATLAVYAWRVGKQIPRFTPGEPVVSLDKSGLPRILPFWLRRQMPTRPFTVKIALTLLSLYRVIKAPLKLKLSTIIDPYTGVIPVSDLRQEVALVMDGLFPHSAASFEFSFSWRFASSAGPNGRHATWSAPWDALAFFWEPRAFKAFASLAPGWITCYVLLLGFLVGLTPAAMRRWIGGRKPIVLGRLSEKEEAAGKVRVFAITDWWTQGVLAKLHDHLFGILKGIPEDGTFNQTRPLRALLERVRLGLPTFSYDLSAATDRLPVSLQVMVLEYILKDPSLAKTWAELLVGRAWHHKVEGPLYYAVGQPMGALSSWAMLALTHHVLVHIAASRIGMQIGTFRDYAILGDDVVIANEHVAAAYLNLMSQLGVEISLAKSLISEGGVIEFAKRLMSPAYDYTPLGAGVLLGARRNPNILPALASDLSDKAFGVLPQHWLGSLGDIVSHYPKGRRGLAAKAIIAALGPAGGLSASLPSWISLENQDWALGWCPPAVVNALQWVISSLIWKEMTSATRSITARYDELWKAWWGTAKGLPKALTLLAPGVWVLGLRLRYLKDSEPTEYNYSVVAQCVDWEKPTMDQIAELLRSSDPVYGPMVETPKTLGRAADKMARLREQVLKVAKLASTDPGVSYGEVTIYSSPPVVYRPQCTSLIRLPTNQS